MLEKLQQVFKNYENPENIAERALSAVEEAGMTPPDCNFYNEEYGVWNHWETEELFCKICKRAMREDENCGGDCVTCITEIEGNG